MTELEIKESKLKNIIFLAAALRKLVSCIDQNAAQIYYEELTLTYYYKCLTSNNLQKRIFGITSLNENIESINKISKQSKSSDYILVSSIDADNDNIQFMDKKYLYFWLTEKKILEVIIGENIHEEILKRAIPIIKVYAERNGLTNEIYDLIISYWSEKHESIAIHLEKIICELTSIITEKVKI